MAIRDQAGLLSHPPLRILHITEAPLGGVLSYLRDIVTAQAESPAVAEVHVLVSEINAPTIDSIRNSKIYARSFRFTRGSLVSAFRLAAQTIRTVRETRPDIVHLHSTVAGIISRLALLCLRQRPKIIYCAHGWPNTSQKRAWPLLVRLERFLARHTDSIVCVSQSDRAIALENRLPAEKCHVVRNGIATAPGLPDLPARGDRAPNDRRTILYVGRFDMAKGFDRFLDVMRALEDVADGLVAGSYIVNKDEHLSVPGNVTMFGWCSPEQLQQLYRSCDLVLMPSRSEGLPLVALEAMRARRPVFASAVGGLLEVVVDGVTGRLLDFADPEAVAAAIRATSLGTLAAYGEQGFARFEAEFTASRMNAAMIDHYNDVMNGRRATA